MSIVSADGLVAYDMATPEDMEYLFHDPVWRARKIQEAHDANLLAIGTALAEHEEWHIERARYADDMARIQERIDREAADDLIAAWDATAPVIE